MERNGTGTDNRGQGNGVGGTEPERAEAQGLFLSDVLYPPEVFVRETRLPALRYFSSVEK